jgi:hypothetical protein
VNAPKIIPIPENELENLKERNRAQAREIQILVEKLHQKNQDVDALHFVWCDGGCPSGLHRYSDVKLTEELIVRAERNTARMRKWYNTVKWRLTSFPTMSQWHDSYSKRAASRTDLLDEPIAIHSDYINEQILKAEFRRGFELGEQNQRLLCKKEHVET